MNDRFASGGCVLNTGDLWEETEAVRSGPFGRFFSDDVGDRGEEIGQTDRLVTLRSRFNLR